MSREYRKRGWWDWRRKTAAPPPVRTGAITLLSPDTRAWNIEYFDRVVFDVLVVGGGAVGAGTAWDAALRGLSVALVEKDDFAGGTSGRSSRMIHGGLRYLKMLDIKLVRESLTERHNLLRMIPHLVRPAPHLMPAFKGDGDSKTIINLGLWGYDTLAGSKGLPPHKNLSAEEVSAMEPTIRPEGLEGALLYYDGLTDDARLTLEVAKAAARAGALIANYTELTNMKLDSEVVTTTVWDRLNDRSMTLRARTVVNAAGAWSDRVRSAFDPGAAVSIRPAKGIHIVFPRNLKPIAHIMILKGSDGRPLFAVPAGRVVYVGTTDTDYDGPLDDPRAEREEVEYLIDAVNHLLTGPPLTMDQVTSSWAGIRPLVTGGKNEETKDISREHSIHVENDRLVTICGGKLTTFRIMAAQTVDKVFKLLTGQDPPPCPTANLMVCPPQPVSLKPPSGLPPSVPKRLRDKYGPQSESILALAATPRLAKVLDEDLGLTAAEIYWAVAAEMAMTLSDVMVRRLGLTHLTPDNGRSLARAVAQEMSRPAGWSRREVNNQVQAYFELVSRLLSFRA